MKPCFRNVLIVGVVGVAATAAITPLRAAADAGGRDAARVELGRRLFFDPAVGRRGQVSCAACHDPEHGFSDPRPRSQDEDRQLARHSQPLVDLAGDGFHWDGEFDTVRDVIDARVLPPVAALKAAADRTLRRLSEAKRSRAELPDDVLTAAVGQIESGGAYGAGQGVAEVFASRQIERSGAGAATSSIASHLSTDGRYDPGFVAAFGDGAVTPKRIGDALEAYLGSVKSTEGPVDRYLAGEKNAIGEPARRGLDLFRGKAGCVQCHVAEGARPLFTDGKFHDTGIGGKPQAKGPDLPPAADDFGRVASTFVETDRGSFKTPSLRDVARRAPYFHDASATTLAEAVRYYDKGGTPNPHLDARIRPLGLADGEVSDLVAFLESLTSSTRPGLGPVTDMRAARLTVHVEDKDGAALVGRTLLVRPFGDRLAGTAAMPGPVAAATNERGQATVNMPSSTHVVVQLDGRDVTPPLPDWTREVRVIVPRKDGVSLRVRFPDGSAERPTWLLARAMVAKGPDSDVTLKKVRDLGPHESLYESDSTAALDHRTWIFGADDYSSGRAFDLRIAPGADNRLDVRAPDVPRDVAVETALRNALVEIASFATPRGGRIEK